MLRDLAMVIIGASSMLIIVALVGMTLKWREREGYRRAHKNYYGSGQGDFSATMRQSRDDYTAHGEFD